MTGLSTILTKKLEPMFGTSRFVWGSALAFVALFLIFEAVFFHETTGKTVTFFETGLDVIGLCLFPIYLGISIYLFALFIQAAIASRPLFKIAYISFFFFVILVEYSYQNALGRFTNFYDIIAALSATGEQRSDSISGYISYLAFLPAAALAILAFRAPVSTKRFGWKMFAGLTVCASLFYLHLSIVKAGFFGNEFPDSSFAIFCESVSDYLVKSPPHFGPIIRAAVKAPERLEPPKNNIILVFDESIRADHLSLNGYSRDTTPFLNDLNKKGLLLNWGTAVSASTSSHPSYDAFIVGVTPADIEHLDFQELSARPSIFQYAKAMGYRTVLFDGQMMDYWGGTKDDLNYIDEFDSLAVIDRPDRVEDWQSAGNKITDESERSEGLKQWEIDEHIAAMVNRIFTTSTGNFIFIYKRGCHFPYEKNFPPSQTIWQPIYHFHEQYEIPPADKLQAVVNSYDNSLKYNLDEFFKKLAPDYSNLPNNTVIIYTGDHGESFYENGRAGHGGSTVGEAAVPLFILGSPHAAVDTGFKASHHNIFATLLDMMNYPTDLRMDGYSQSLLKATSADSTTRYFNPDGGKKVRFDQ